MTAFMISLLLLGILTCLILTISDLVTDRELDDPIDLVPTDDLMDVADAVQNGDVQLPLTSRDRRWLDSSGVQA